MAQAVKHASIGQAQQFANASEFMRGPSSRERLFSAMTSKNEWHIFTGLRLEPFKGRDDATSERNFPPCGFGFSFVHE